MDLNNIYNFKNTIRHFININNLKYPQNPDVTNLSWTIPIAFRIQKDTNNFRTLKLPNILNLFCAYKYYLNLPNFFKLNDLDPTHNRLTVNLDTGDFIAGEYDRQLTSDFMNLCLYDSLLKLDIHEFYGKIYTHYLDMGTLKDNVLAGLNNGRTGGIIMGNYLSLYFAQVFLKTISNSFSEELYKASLDCHFEYFSDDFYIFCNNHDISEITTIFKKVLSEYDFECNDSKRQIWTYETYNKYNLLTRFWKSIIRHWNLEVLKDSEIGNKHQKFILHNLTFLNQIIYKLSNLDDIKNKKSLVCNFFKTKHFQTTDFNKYTVRNYDYHQLCYLLKLAPESLLYTSHIFANMSEFDNEKIKPFLLSRFKEALIGNLNDVQLYYYYAIKIYGFSSELITFSQDVLTSENQILISYYLQENLFLTEQISKLKSLSDEKYWFQNYHLILYTPDLFENLENSIQTYLIPIALKSKKSKKALFYLNFYLENLSKEISLINYITDITKNITNYLSIRYDETKNNNYNHENEEDEDWNSIDYDRESDCPF